MGQIKVEKSFFSSSTFKCCHNIIRLIFVTAIRMHSFIFLLLFVYTFSGGINFHPVNGLIFKITIEIVKVKTSRQSRSCSFWDSYEEDLRFVFWKTTYFKTIFKICFLEDDLYLTHFYIFI